ncbi:MAG: response regulator [Acidobacteria bacterium]|nr:response regulator [Acidobacteriota bacterium]MBI3488375.1 response regulator [Acidobacteriota bacterium]
MSAGRPLRAALVDDEPLARSLLRQALAPHADVQIVGECGDGDEALARLPEWAPDLLFLDIHMPGLDGFELLRALEVPPLVVFTTAHDQHALRAFEAQAMDYLLKPLDPARVDQALDKVRLQVAGRLREAPPEAPAPSTLQRLIVRRGPRLVPLRVADLDWIGAEGNYVALHQGEATYLHRETLAGLESRLEPGRFLRIHRGILVNIDRVLDLQPGPNGDAVLRLSTGATLPLSRRYKAQVRRRLAR